ncbi:MBL fold metallo-hydrolase [Longispora albida]|uniref:MBL fold metallo-hydrolase n=1 Tax=Longispora albida TaxID=203523 RepID=UPI00036EDC88|nr:MBL fold metallo-hydrolase [Longispora albida]
MTHTRTIGTATVVALADGHGSLDAPRAEAFPSATAADWARADALDPHTLTADGQWSLWFRAYAIRLGEDEVVIVDAGIGPADSPASSWAPVPGTLPDELAAAGIKPEQVRRVVLTHLHPDHIGWSGLFPDASLLVQRAEWEWIPEELRELIPADRLELLDGETTLAPGVTVLPTPGHTPGHQSVLVSDGESLVAITGDLFVHAIQVVAPEAGFAHEMDQDAARQSRLALLDLVTRHGGELATPHLTAPFVQPSR